MSDNAVYRHSQTYTALWLILCAVLAVCLPLVLIKGGEDMVEAVLLLVVPLLGSLLLLGRLVVEVRADALHWHFGYVGWPAWTAAFKEIEGIEVAKADLVFGSGIKRRGLHRQYNTVINGPALRIRLKDGRSITLGTPEPQRVLGFLEPRLALRHR